jgi:hypothetical protein
MSVRSFHSVFMATAVAGAALGCYLVSLRVASERAALEQVERQIVQTQRDIRLIQTEIGTRARLAQLERWNVRVLALSAPTADQILGDRFQLASLVEPKRDPVMTAPVVLAAAPAKAPQQLLAPEAPPPAANLLREAGLKLPSSEAPAKAAARELTPDKPSRPATVAARTADNPAKPAAGANKPLAKADEAGTAKPSTKTAAAKAPVRTAQVDPLAPLPAEASTAKGPRTSR